MGNGITFSLIAAEIIKDAIMGRKNTDAAVFSFDIYTVWTLKSLVPFVRMRTYGPHKSFIGSVATNR